jgi:hypothetical protein
MVTIFRAEGLRFVIFVDDHAPAHVHVFGDGEAKINLTGPRETPELVWADGMKRTDIRRAMRHVTTNKAWFLKRWIEIHGRVDRRRD